MPEDRIPYNIEFCRYIVCDKKAGNKCELTECKYNHKWVVYWETHGEYPPNGGD